MGKKRITIIGDLDSEEALKKEREVAREQKKLREQKTEIGPQSSNLNPPDQSSGLDRQTSKNSKKKIAISRNEKVHIAGQKGGERVKSMESEIEAEALVVARKLKEAGESVAKSKASAKKVTVTRKRGRAYLSAKVKVDPTRKYPLDEAVKLLLDMPQPRFTQTLELHINTHAKGLSITVELPFATGQVRRAGVADDTTLDEIEKGKISFDILFASPAQMPRLAKLAKTLGPRGLMPNPKNGTVVTDPEKAAEEYSTSSKTTLKTQADAAVIHAVVGKLNQKDSELLANLSAILTAVKPQNMRSVVLKSTMSPAVKLQVSS